MKNWLVILLLSLARLYFAPDALFAQQSSNGIALGFQSKSTVFKNDGVLHNVVKISNNTQKLYRFHIDITPPGGWNHVGAASREISIEGGDSLFLPVNIIPNAAIRGGDVYVCNVRVFADEFMVGSDNWVVSVEKISDLKVVPENNRFWFREGRDTADFSLLISNYGNAEENLLLDVSSMRRQLLVFDAKGSDLGGVRVLLEPGEDTLLHYQVAINRKFKGEQEYDVLQKTDNTENYSLRLKVVNGDVKAGPVLWKNNLIFTKVPSYYRENLTGSVTLPMSLQLDAYNVLQNSTYMSLQASGNTVINKVNELTYLYQTNFSSNVFDANTLLGDYAFAGYYTPKYFGEIGNIVINKEGASISGIGVKGGYEFGNQSVDVGVVGNPSVFDIRRWGASAEHRFNSNSKKLKTSAFVMFEDNKDIFQKNLTVIPSASYRINNNHFVKLSGGYNQRTYSANTGTEFIKHGLGLRLGYSGRMDNFTFSLASRLGSPTYEPSPGLRQVTGNVGYFHADGLKSQLLLSHFSSRPDVYNNTGLLVQSGMRSRSNQIEYKVSKSEDAGVLTGSTYYRQRLYQNLFMRHEGVGVAYYQRFTAGVRMSANLNADMNQLPNMSELGSFFTSRFKATLRFGDNMLVNFRYHYGPFYYYEFTEYTTEGTNPQSIFINGYVDKWFGGNRFLGRINANYNYRMQKEHHILNSRPELFFYAKNGFRFNAYSNLSWLRKKYYLDPEGLISGTASSFHVESGIGVKKDFGIPVSRKRYFDARFEAFDDVNGNGSWDRGEEGIENVLVRLIPEQVINEDGEESALAGYYHVLSNKKGLGVIDNMQAGRYALLVEPLDKQHGILTTNIDQLDLVTDKTILLPFASGGVVTGSISIEKARVSQFDEGLNIANIRVSAIDQAGKEYSALTNENGYFEVYVPVGVYVVSINQQVFGKSFMVMQNYKTIKLTKKSSKTFVNFYVKETERKMNIKRF